LAIGQVISLAADLVILAKQQQYLNATNYLQDLLLAEKIKFDAVALTYKTQAETLAGSPEQEVLRIASQKCTKIANALDNLANNPAAIAEFWLKPQFRTTTEWKDLKDEVDAFNEMTLGAFLSGASAVLGLALMTIPVTGVAAMAVFPNASRFPRKSCNAQINPKRGSGAIGMEQQNSHTFSQLQD
jgi:hypothetical protein